MLFVNDLVDKKVAIRCLTEDDAKTFLKMCDDVGIRWHTGDAATEITEWHEYEDDTCYIIETESPNNSTRRLWYANVEWFEDCGYMIINFVEE